MESTPLDDFDRAILRALQAEGRLSVQDLSDRVGLSPSPVSRRCRSAASSPVAAVTPVITSHAGSMLFTMVDPDQVNEVDYAFTLGFTRYFGGDSP